MRLGSRGGGGRQEQAVWLIRASAGTKRLPLSKWRTRDAKKSMRVGKRLIRREVCSSREEVEGDGEEVEGSSTTDSFWGGPGEAILA